jgi:hypothetical protein
MDEFESPGTEVAKLTDDEFEKLYDELEEDLGVERGGPAARLAAFFGIWRPPSGHNLRVGILSGDRFLPAETAGLDLVQDGQAVNFVLNRFYLPDLPHERCTAQVMWTAAHWFRDSKKPKLRTLQPAMQTHWEQRQPLVCRFSRDSELRRASA